MSNKLLKKMLENRELFTEDDVFGYLEAEVIENDMYLSILDSLSEGHVIIDKEGIVRYFNRTVFSLVPPSKAYGLDEGKNIGNVFHDKDMKAFVLDVINGKQKPEPKDFTIGSMNELRTIRFEFRRLECDGDYYLDIVISDISERIRKETRLRRSESLASMTTMAAGIAHDIKNPLAAMKIHIQLMQKFIQKKGMLDAEGAERYLSVLEEEIDHLNRIAVDFLFDI